MRNHFGIRSLFSSLTAKPMRRFGKRGQSVKAESLESRMLLTATLYSISGYSRTAPNVGADDTIDSDASVNSGITQIYTLSQGVTNNSIDAGYTHRAAIGNFVWNDLNADGIQDALEPGIPNATVNLKNDLGFVIRTTTTDAEGMYWFTNLVPGAYSVQSRTTDAADKCLCGNR